MDIFIIFGAKYLYILVVLLAAVGLWFSKKEERLNLVKLSILALPIAFVVDKIMNHLIVDPRPFVVEHITPLVAHAPDNGFPSDHTMLTMSLALIIFVSHKKLGIVLIILSLLVGLSRVFAHIHHMEDILGSIIIAAFVVWFSFLFLKRMKLFS
jgi:undecaprenyl-diphosphatase